MGSPSIPPPPPPPQNDFYITPPPPTTSVPFAPTPPANFLTTAPLLAPLAALRTIPPDEEARIHSTVAEQSDPSDEEDIDVVKSAFVPIKPASVLLKEIQQQHPDSTVADKETKVEQRCDLKATSAKSIKNLCSPNTKLHHPQTKSVWRPY